MQCRTIDKRLLKLTKVLLAGRPAHDTDVRSFAYVFVPLEAKPYLNYGVPA